MRNDAVRMQTLPQTWQASLFNCGNASRSNLPKGDPTLHANVQAQQSIQLSMIHASIGQDVAWWYEVAPKISHIPIERENHNSCKHRAARCPCSMRSSAKDLTSQQKGQTLSP